MTNRKTRLEQIDELIINEILATPDDEIIEEVGKRISQPAARRCRLRRRGSVNGGSNSARAQLEASKATARVVPIDSASVKAAKAKLLASDPALRGKLTLAARNASRRKQRRR